MHKISAAALCSVLATCLAPAVLAQSLPSAESYYGVVEGGVLGLDLPSFSFFQRFNAAGTTPLRDLTTGDGNETSPIVGGMIGAVFVEPWYGGRVRFEKSGFYSRQAQSTWQRFASAGWTDIDGGNSIAALPGDSLSTNTRREVSLFGGDLLLKYDAPTNGPTHLSPYAGLFIFNMRQVFEVDGRLPTQERTRLVEDLRSIYVGPTIGLETAFRLGKSTQLVCDADVILYFSNFEREADQVSVDGGARTISVKQDTQRFTPSARLRLELIQKFRCCDFKLFGTAQYLDNAPVVDYGAGPSRLSLREAWGVTGGVSLRFDF